MLKWFVEPSIGRILIISIYDCNCRLNMNHFFKLEADSRDGGGSATVASDLPIVPNYMRNPVFPYGSSSNQVLSQRTPSTVSQGRADATSHSSSGKN